MPSRGTYRTVHSSLPDDPDFQELSPAAKLVFHTLRLCREHRASGIFRYYLQTIVIRTGLTTRQVTAALTELATPKPREDYGWIVYDDAILWIVNGLRYDPHISLANPHHVTTVRNELSELPRRKMVLSYCDYYKQPYPFTWVEPTHSQQDSETKETKENKDSESKDTDGSDRTAEPSAALDPTLQAILADCPNLALVSNGESGPFWDQVLSACEPYGVADAAWIGKQLRQWDAWFSANPTRKSRDRRRLEARLLSWLSKDLDRLSTTRRPT